MTTDNTGDTDQSKTRGLPASRRTTLQLLSAATLGKATGTVAAFDAFVAEELDTENTDEWFLRLNDPLGYTVDSASAGTLKQAAFAAQEPVVDAVSRMDGVRARGQFWIPNAVLVAAPDRSIEELRAIEGVTTVHPNFEVSLPEPADEQRITLAPDGETTYGLDQLDLSDAREEYGVDGDGVTVSIVDTGADPGHQDIEVAEFLELDEDGEIVWDTLEDEEAAEEVANDPEGHGTHVAGTAVGRNESEEFDIGVAPAADHVSAKVFPGEQRSTTFANIAEGLQWSVEAEADVVNLSLGGAGFFPGYVEPVQQLTGLGIHVVASSGNDGPATGGSPGNVFDSTAVGATDRAETVVEFSSGRTVYTPEDWTDFPPPFDEFEPPADWPTFYTVPDISAPGDDVLSAATGTDAGYTRLSGTSMAAPHAAGLVALLRQGAELDVGETQELLADTAVHPEGIPFGIDDPDAEDPERVVREDRDLPGVGYGFGIVNAFNAMTDLEESGRVFGAVSFDNDQQDPAVGIDVTSDWGTRTGTVRDGLYSVPVREGEREITAETFGAEATATVTVEGDTEQDLVLEPTLDLELLQGQPPDMADGDSFEMELSVANLEGVEIDAEVDLRQVVLVSALLDDGDGALYQVDLHETDAEGNLEPEEFVGATPVTSGQAEELSFVLVDDDGNPVDLVPDDYVAMIHIVDDDDVEEGDFFPPGTFPVLPKATPDDELIGSGITDGGQIDEFVNFPDQAIDLEEAEEDGAHVVIEDLATDGAEAALIVTYEQFDQGDEIVVDLDNEGSAAWEVLDVSGGTDTVEHIVEEDQFNPTLLLAEGVQYTFEDLPGETHPLEFLDDDGNVLLSQASEGSFEDDEDVDWQDDGDEVSFTVTGALLEALAEYRCAIHSGDMVGDVTAGTGLVIAGLEIDVFGGPGNIEDVSVEIADQGGFPGPHTAHLVLAADLSSDYDVGDTVSPETAEAVVFDDEGTAFAADLTFEDQSSDPEGVTVELAGEEIPLGERVDIGDDTGFEAPLTGAVPVTVTVDGAEDGTQFTLTHTFDGLDEELTVETGPTTVLVDPNPVSLDITEADLDDVVGSDGVLDSGVTIQNTGELTALDETAFLEITDVVDFEGEPLTAFFDVSLPDVAPGEEVELDFPPILFGVGGFPRQEATQIAYAGGEIDIDPSDGPSIVGEDDSVAETFSIQNAEFDAEIDAPEEAPVDGQVDVTVTVTNLGEFPGIASFDFQFDGITITSVETDELAPEGGSEAVSISVPTDGLATGVYEHGIVPTAGEFGHGPRTQTIELVEPEGPPQIDPSFAGPPIDVTGDGLYENITGDGEFDILDVQALFDNLDNPTLQANAQFFDFADLGDDNVTIFDVQALFTRLQEERE